MLFGTSRHSPNKDLVTAEWTILVGETIVTVGSVVVVIGLVRTLNSLLKNAKGKG